MGRLTKEQWADARARYEAGASMGAVSAEFGVSKPVVSVRARKEGWCQDTSGVVRRLAEAKANGIPNDVSEEKKAEAFDAASQRVAEVMARHRDEWRGHDALVAEAVEKRDFALAKLAKITAETIAIRQAGERKAWGIADKEQPKDKKGSVIVVKLADEEQEF